MMEQPSTPIKPIRSSSKPPLSSTRKPSPTIPNFNQRYPVIPIQVPTSGSQTTKEGQLSILRKPKPSGKCTNKIASTKPLIKLAWFHSQLPVSPVINKTASTKPIIKPACFHSQLPVSPVINKNASTKPIIKPACFHSQLPVSPVINNNIASTKPIIKPACFHSQLPVSPVINKNASTKPIINLLAFTHSCLSRPSLTKTHQQNL
jgi:hypothetical protein